MFYDKNGIDTSSAGGGIDGQCLSLSFANWLFALSTDANADGNVVAEWQDVAGGTFVKMNVRASVIAATYYTK